MRSESEQKLVSVQKNLEVFKPLLIRKIDNAIQSKRSEAIVFVVFIFSSIRSAASSCNFCRRNNGVLKFKYDQFFHTYGDRQIYIFIYISFPSSHRRNIQIL